jgi:prepilin-type N-terminal cleavage/methylation domain-containing protein
MILKLIKREEGISLIEVLVALAILGVIAATFLTALSVSSKGVMISDERAVAESLARSQMESVREQLYITAPTGGEATYLVIDTSEQPSFTIWSVNRDEEVVEGVIGVPWNSEDDIATEQDLGLQSIKLVIKNYDKEVLILENYKVGR